MVVWLAMCPLLKRAGEMIQPVGNGQLSSLPRCKTPQPLQLAESLVPRPCKVFPARYEDRPRCKYSIREDFKRCLSWVPSILILAICVVVDRVFFLVIHMPREKTTKKKKEQVKREGEREELANPYPPLPLILHSLLFHFP